jgi:hypothetical protein
VPGFSSARSRRFFDPDGDLDAAQALSLPNRYLLPGTGYLKAGKVSV